MSWDNVERGLASRVELHAAERQAREQALKYEVWARHAVDECLDDLTRDLTHRVAHFDEAVRRGLTTKTFYPSHLVDSEQRGVQRVLSIELALDQVHIHGQWSTGNAPTVHLLWSRRQQNRYCQMVPVTGGRLVPRHSMPKVDGSADNTLVGYRILAGESSRDELSREQLLLRALGLLASGARQ
jgi:hypothetical protein